MVKTAKERLETLDKVLDEYLQSKGLPQYQPDNEVQQFLNLDRKQLRSLSKEDAGEGYFLLQRFAFYLQMEYNKEESRLHWAETNLNNYVSAYTAKYQYAGFEEKKHRVINSDEYAKKLWQIHTYAQSRVDRMNFLSNRVTGMALALKDLQQSKNK